jgi:Putative sensor
MVTLVQPHGTSVRWRRSAPWSGPARRQALYLAGGIPAQLAALIVLLPWAAGLRWRSQWFPLYWPGGAGKLWPLTPIGLAVVFLAAPALTAMHRHRLRSTAGVRIPPPLAIGNRWSLPGILAYAQSRATWRQLGYHFLAAPAIAVAAAAVIWAGDRLHIIISDDGVGGADPGRGTGLTGLANRAASVDGTLEIASPPGGPTLLTVDLPCAR